MDSDNWYVRPDELLDRYVDISTVSDDVLNESILYAFNQICRNVSEDVAYDIRSGNINQPFDFSWKFTKFKYLALPVFQDSFIQKAKELIA